MKLALWILTAPALLATMAAVPRADAQTSTAPTLKPCRIAGVEHEVRCGTVSRALDPAAPQGTHIDVHYAVLPALARNKHPDPVFFLAGGPGQSAIGLAGTVLQLQARLANRRDLVLVDQRGTGRSAPLHCEEPAPTLPLAQVLDVRWGEARLAACLAKLKLLPHGDLRHYTTTVAMQDLDAVRAALGAERINLVGGSYGTRAALEYQRQFPHRVRRVVIDGLAPPDMVLPASFAPDNEAALSALLAACQAEPACAKRHPQLQLQLQHVLAGLPRRERLVHPLTGELEEVNLERELIVSVLRQALYSPVVASALPLAIEQAAAGRFDALMGLGVAQAGPRRARKLAEGMHFAVVCAEDVPRLLSDGAAASNPVFGASFASYYQRLCAHVPRGEVSEAFYRIPPAKAPALVFSGGIDPATPPRHGQRVAEALGVKARHIVVPNAGHGVMGLGCLRDVIFRFIDAAEDAAAMQLDATCAQALPRPPAFSLPLGAKP